MTARPQHIGDLFGEARRARGKLICRECGTKLPSGAPWCLKCGPDEQHDIGDLFDPRFAVRRSDPPTSHQAARRNPFARMNDLRRVLETHNRNRDGLTDFQLAALLDRKQTSVGKRRFDLCADGLIEETAERRPSDTGSPSIVWKITAKGIETAIQLHQGSCAS